MPKLQINQNFNLELGGQLPYLEIAYETYGTFNPTANNVVWVCHALTGNADVFDWWPGLFGENDLYNPKDYFIICANVLGSCYGTTGPLQADESTKFHQFPEITIRDMVKAHELLRKHLGIQNIHTLIGGSLGGQQALEWAVQQPELFEHFIGVATNAKHSAWGIAFNETQRMSIELDSTWKENHSEAGINGMKAARAAALVSYRSYAVYEQTQTDDTDDKVDDFKASSYQRYQGDKLAKRFNAYSYYHLSKAMDSHNIGRGRGGIAKALAHFKIKSLFIGVSSDLLFPLSEQKLLAEYIDGAFFESIDSIYGHDGFLIETQKISERIAYFYQATEYEERIQPAIQKKLISINCTTKK